MAISKFTCEKTLWTTTLKQVLYESGRYPASTKAIGPVCATATRITNELIKAQLLVDLGDRFDFIKVRQAETNELLSVHYLSSFTINRLEESMGRIVRMNAAEDEVSYQTHQVPQVTLENTEEDNQHQVEPVEVINISTSDSSDIQPQIESSSPDLTIAECRNAMAFFGRYRAHYRKMAKVLEKSLDLLYRDCHINKYGSDNDITKRLEEALSLVHEKESHFDGAMLLFRMQAKKQFKTTSD